MPRTPAYAIYHTHRFGTKPTPQDMPHTCPVCQEAVDLKTIPEHIRLQHPPPDVEHRDCRALQTDRSYVLDWDVVKHGKPGQELYFCQACGRYAPEVRVGTPATDETWQEGLTRLFGGPDATAGEIP